jgi:hypothetical protein
MTRTMRSIAAILLVLVLSFALAACRRDKGDGGGGGYMPAPGSTVPAAAA